ncbi:MAG: hypothetical protein KDK34_07325 [Leptospiraceae bacterium]|nr:hypothetical protein [Leptospiraceae bacterium]
MAILEFLTTPSGLAFLHFTQTIMFSTMVYILSAEYYRTRRDDLVYKLIASGSITAINIATTTVLVLKVFYEVNPSQRVLPLLFNAVFAIICLALARAFIYDTVRRKYIFDRFMRFGILGILLSYIIIQFYWWFSFKPGMVFGTTIYQLLFSVFFVLILIVSMNYIIRYRKKYRIRLCLAFGSIVVAQLVNIYTAAFETVPGYLRAVQAAAPLLVPTMFGSVVFKELIENVVITSSRLRRTLEDQQILVHEMSKTGAELTRMSDHLFNMARDGWQKLSGVVEIMYDEEQDRQDISKLSAATIRNLESAGRESQSGLEQMRQIFQQEGLVHSLPEHADQLRGTVESLGYLIDNSFDIFERTEQLLQSLFQSRAVIAEALKGVEDLSEQTNMLALNASIEAARAGESGRGFAVVAEKVGELAGKSRGSTAEVTGRLNEIMQSAQATGDLIHSGMRNLNRSFALLSELKNVSGLLLEAARLPEQIFSGYQKIGEHQQKEFDSIHDRMLRSIRVIEKNSVNGQKMKEALRTHIHDIESIAGVSDQLKDLTRELSVKAESAVQNAERMGN